jgi:hypothetical protein
MGLLKSAGRELKGLLRGGGLVDSLSQAQAFLDGDYGRGMSLAGRAADRRRALRERRRAQMPRASLDRPYEGMVVDDPELGRMVLSNGEWMPWGC